jgi:hypothetical protein
MDLSNKPKNLENLYPKTLGWPDFPKFVNYSPMGRPIKAMPKRGTQAERMQRLRLAMKCETQTEFAKKYGFGVTTWSNFENGFPVSRAAAKRLVQQIPGLSTGWIEDGATGDLSRGMATKLGEP